MVRDGESEGSSQANKGMRDRVKSCLRYFPFTFQGSRSSEKTSDSCSLPCLGSSTGTYLNLLLAIDWGTLRDCYLRASLFQI